MAGLQITRNLAKEINEAKYFSLIADETQDISRKEQVCICIRFVYKHMCIKESFLGMVETDNTDSATLVKLLMDALSSVGIPLENCDVFKSTNEADTAISVLTNVTNFIKSSPHRLAMFNNFCLSEDRDNVGRSLRPMCPTRW
uniref:uncharacterized protein LOC101243506 n=1 Tax=Ciona intestinalis TaxID=7719 RepID=UPI0002B8D4AE